MKIRSHLTLPAGLNYENHIHDIFLSFYLTAHSCMAELPVKQHRVFSTTVHGPGKLNILEHKYIASDIMAKGHPPLPPYPAAIPGEGFSH